MAWHKWFIPHRDTHKKAHLISWQAFLVYGLIYIILHNSLSLIGLAKPGILGTSSNIQSVQIISLTNDERAKDGLPPLKENTELDQAAEAKAQNMFAEDYWAHFSPAGKSPWDFILAAGYKFTYAGENLAKSFTNSNDVVAAWMASPTHKENIVNNHYQDIGVAVEDGVINGQKTTLVVQEFGATSSVVNLALKPSAPPSSQPTAQPTTQPSVEVPQASAPVVVPANEFTQKLQASAIPISAPAIAPAQIQAAVTPLFDPIKITKTYSLAVITLITVLLLVDFIVLRRRGVFRLSSHHLVHMAILSVAATAIFTSHSGQILDGYQMMAPPPNNQYVQNP